MAVGVPLPLTLPQVPNVDGYQTSPQSNVVVFQPEVGEAKVRRRGTARTKPQTAAFNCTAAQVAIFEDFFEDDLKDGVLRMAWTDPLRGDLADWKFDNESPYVIVPLSGAVDIWVMTWRLMRLP